MSSAPTPATPQDRPTPGVALKAVIPGQEQLLPPGVLALLVSLHRAIEPERQARLAARQARQAEFDAGALPDFRADTREIREGDWTVAPIPAHAPKAPTAGAPQFSASARSAMPMPIAGAAARFRLASARTSVRVSGTSRR